MIGKILTVLVILISAIFFTVHPVKALTEEEEGAKIWQKLNSNQIKCEEISDTQFENLGEFFMGRMLGSSHETMNQQMEQMMGKEGTDQMHIIMGKRMSGCQVNATAPGITGNMMNLNMMGMMMNPSVFNQKGGGGLMMGPGMMGWGSWGSGTGSGWMMGQASGVFWIWSLLSWLTWILVIVALVAFIRWMWKKGDKK